NSHSVAEKLASFGPITIGATSKIGSDTAREAASEFYWMLASASTVQAAYEAANTVATTREPKLEMKLYPGNANPRVEGLHFLPVILARPSDGEWSGNRFDLAVFGCPRNTNQIVFFTDDDEFAGKDPGRWEVNLCTVQRGNPVRKGLASILWRSEAWR